MPLDLMSKYLIFQMKRKDTNQIEKRVPEDADFTTTSETASLEVETGVVEHTDSITDEQSLHEQTESKNDDESTHELFYLTRLH
jgi:hypothetical protein